MHGSERGVIAVIAALTITTTGGAATLRVPEDHPTIQAGVTAAAAGDTVLVGPGRYAELIRMRNGIVLRSAAGPDSTILECPGLAERLVHERIIECLDGIDESTVIEGLTFEPGGVKGMGIYCDRASPSIRGNVFRALGWGMHVQFGDPRIEGNIIEECTLAGIMIRASSPEITRNVIRNNAGNGIIIAGKESHPVIGGSPDRTNRIYGNIRESIFNESRNDVDATWNDWGHEVTAEMNRKGYPADIITILDGNEHGFKARGKGKVDYQHWIQPEVESAKGVGGLNRVVIPVVAILLIAGSALVISRRRASPGVG